jgi:hypothetical protein
MKHEVVYSQLVTSLYLFGKGYDTFVSCIPFRGKIQEIGGMGNDLLYRA